MESDSSPRLIEARNECARIVLDLCKRNSAGHVGSSLGCLELLVDLCFARMVGDDKLVLSKGHAAAALYAVLKLSGRLPECELETFYKDGTLLAGHPPCTDRIKEIPFGTGSLGHGLGLASGLVFSQRYTGKNFQVFTVLSEGDCNEGSTWEAVLFAAHHRLTNLTVIIDLNGLQGFGTTHEVLNLEPIEDKWRSFGFAVEVLEHGNSFPEIAAAHERIKDSALPKCLIAKTIKGHGISFMENRLEWHYLSMKDHHYSQALSELNQLPTSTQFCS